MEQERFAVSICKSTLLAQGLTQHLQGAGRCFGSYRAVWMAARALRHDSDMVVLFIRQASS